MVRDGCSPDHVAGSLGCMDLPRKVSLLNPEQSGISFFTPDCNYCISGRTRIGYALTTWMSRLVMLRDVRRASPLRLWRLSSWQVTHASIQVFLFIPLLTMLYPPDLLIESSKHVLLQAWQADRTCGHNYLPASVFAVSPCPPRRLPIILTSSSDLDMIKVSSEVSDRPNLQN